MPRSLRTLGLVALVALAVVGLAIALTPPVYELLRAHGWIAEDKFLKVLRRLLLIPLLLLLFAWLRPWRDGGPRSYGLLGERARIGPGLLGFAVTVVVLLGLLAWHFQEGWLAWERPFDLGRGLSRAARWLGVALVLAVMEEWFFRGWLDRRLRRVVAPGTAVVLGALLYAAVHAFKPSRLDVPVPHTAAGAWTGLLWWLQNLVNPVEFGPKLVGLFLFGLVLLGAWRRTRTLWTSIGIHAAGIFVLRSYGAFTDRSPERTWAGGKELFDGPPGWILLAASAILFWWPRSPSGEPAGVDAGSRT